MDDKNTANNELRKYSTSDEDKSRFDKITNSRPVDVFIFGLVLIAFALVGISVLWGPGYHPPVLYLDPLLPFIIGAFSAVFLGLIIRSYCEKEASRFKLGAKVIGLVGTVIIVGVPLLFFVISGVNQLVVLFSFVSSLSVAIGTYWGVISGLQFKNMTIDIDRDLLIVISLGLVGLGCELQIIGFGAFGLGLITDSPTLYFPGLYVQILLPLIVSIGLAIGLGHRAGKLILEKKGEKNIHWQTIGVFIVGALALVLVVVLILIYVVIMLFSPNFPSLLLLIIIVSSGLAYLGVALYFVCSPQFSSEVAFPFIVGFFLLSFALEVIAIVFPHFYFIDIHSTYGAALYPQLSLLFIFGLVSSLGIGTFWRGLVIHGKENIPDYIRKNKLYSVYFLVGVALVILFIILFPVWLSILQAPYQGVLIGSFSTLILMGCIITALHFNSKVAIRSISFGLVVLCFFFSIVAVFGLQFFEPLFGFVQSPLSGSHYMLILPFFLSLGLAYGIGSSFRSRSIVRGNTFNLILMGVCGFCL
ncbi:MAG: hypothetical protein ACFFBD_26550, partial [Candidatus Hodarchaeota archaeon]